MMIRNELLRLPNRTIQVSLCGSGVPILFLHGYPLDNRLWSSVMPLLADQFLCIAPDLRGFGKSAEEQKSFRLVDLADDCAKLLDILQVTEQVVVCGLSMGGYVAMEFIDRYPSRVSRAILTNTRCNADDAVAASHRRSVGAVALRDGTKSAVEPMLSKLLSLHSMETQPETVALVQSMMLSTFPSTIAWAQMAMSQRSDFTERMASWNLPVLCVGGQDDPICPVVAIEQMRNAIPGATSIFVAESAHLTPLEKPQQFATLCKQSS